MRKRKMHGTIRVSDVATALEIEYKPALKFCRETLGGYQLVPRGEVMVPVSAFLEFCDAHCIDPGPAFGGVDEER